MATKLFLLPVCMSFCAGVFFCLLSLLSAVVLGLFDRRASRIMKRADAKTGMLLLLLLLFLLFLLLLSDLIGYLLGEVINLRDIRYFPLSLWLICLICVLYYVTVFPFVGLGM